MTHSPLRWFSQYQPFTSSAGFLFRSNGIISYSWGGTLVMFMVIPLLSLLFSSAEHYIRCNLHTNVGALAGHVYLIISLRMTFPMFPLGSRGFDRLIMVILLLLIPWSWRDLERYGVRFISLGIEYKQREYHVETVQSKFREIADNSISGNTRENPSASMP